MLNPKSKFYRWGPIDACPLFLYYSIKPAFALLKKLFGTTYSESLIIFKDGKGTWLLNLEQLLKESKKFVDTIILKDKKLQWYLNLWNQRTHSLLQCFTHLDKTPLPSLTNTSFQREFQKFTRYYYEWFTVTISHELITSSLEPLVSKRLQKYAPAVFSTLTAPEKLSFYRQEQRDFIRILSLEPKKQQWALKNHQKQYYWIYNSYVRAHVLDTAYFQSELHKLQHTNYEKTLKEIESYTSSLQKKKKKKIVQEHDFSHNDRKLIALITKFAELLDERKMINFRVDHYLELFTQEFSRRTSVSVAQLKSLLPEELAGILKNADIQYISDRETCFVLSCTANSIELFEGKMLSLLQTNLTPVWSLKMLLFKALLHPKAPVDIFGELLK